MPSISIIIAQSNGNNWFYAALVLFIIYFGLVLFCLLDALRATFKDSVTKLIWVAIILFFPFFGSVIYLAIGRKNKLI